MVIRAFYINISVNNLYVRLANRDNYFPDFSSSIIGKIIGKKKTVHIKYTVFLELIPRFELGTSSLPRMRSTD